METSNPQTRLIGVISDTHGLLRPEAIAALRDVELILHAGDVDRPEILDRLRSIAPVTAVRGNVDHGSWAYDLPQREILQIDDVHIYMLHNLDHLDLVPETADIHVVIYGHSHIPEITRDNGVLYLNPGSAGSRRFRYPATVALMRIQGSSVEAELVELDVD